MHDTLQKLLQTKRYFIYQNENIQICTGPDSKTAGELLKEIIYTLTDQKTALFLSFDSILKPIYESLAKEEKLHPGVVGLTDEIYGGPVHDASNERLIAQTGLVRYFSMRDIPYYSFLHGVSITDSTERYDELFRSLNTVYPKSIGILPVTMDGRIAGITKNLKDNDKYAMVSYNAETNGSSVQRMTLTPLALSMIDLLICPLFGSENKQLLNDILDSKKNDLPVQILKRADISPKVLMITDQTLSQQSGGADKLNWN